MTDKIHLGIWEGEEGDQGPVDIEIFHTLFAGQTNLSGKTTTIRALLPEALKLGYTVLVFDTKPNAREFEGYNDVPVCYRNTTDPLVLIGLLESIRKARLSNLYATLGRATEGAKSTADIIKALAAMEADSRSGFIRDACYSLRDLLVRLQDEIGGIKTSTELELDRGKINVMAINDLSTEAQQLVVKTAFELVIRVKKVITVVDEGFRFLPQDYGSPCKRPIQDIVTQGARTKCFAWVGTQFLAPTDKDAMKAMANKLLGRQDHNTEVEHTQKLIPGGKKAWPDQEIMTLKRGEFIFVSMDGSTKKVYVDRPVLAVEEPDEGPRPPSKIGRMEQDSLQPREGARPSPLAPSSEEEDWSEVVAAVEKVEAVLR